MKTVLGVGMLVIILAASISNMTPANAWGPNTHIIITKKSLEAAKDSIIKSQIEQYPEAFYAGVVFPDVSVLYYYTQFESYKSTHNWLFYRRLLEEAGTVEEKAFAYGVACHLIQDTVAHNNYVPIKIQGTLGSNLYTHPLVEASVEARYFDLTTSGSLEPVERFLPLAQRALGRDVSGMTYMFRGILRAGSFYEDAYAVPNVPLWDLYSAGAGIAQGLYGTQDAEAHLTQAEALTVKFFEAGETPLRDPTGIDALTGAGRTSDAVRFSLTFGVALVVGFILVRRRRG